MVLQDNVLFEGTIRENIEIGKPGASFEEIIDAAKKAHIHDTIMSYPDKYDTEVREQDKNFSGGQRQRLAIARAVLRDSPILILDEPTASLDVEAEVEVLRAIDTLVIGRTVLMISHRLSTLGNVDEIIVLEEGRIVEQGTYKELKRRNGIFASLHKAQTHYNVDYAGGSMIVPRVELERLINQQGRSVAPYQQPSPITLLPVRPESVPVSPARGQSVAVGSSSENPQQQTLKAHILVEVDGKIVGQRQLDKPILTVGRLSGNAVHVPSQHVSRLHAKIRWESGAWVIEDAESLNGLIFNGQRVDRHILRKGDRIYLAPAVVIQYEPM